MKNKLILLTGTITLAIILFCVSTYMQKKIIDYEPKVECLFLKQDIKENNKLEEEMFYKDEIDISLIANIKIVQNFEEIKDLYAKDNIYKGQIALYNQFDTKENLSIYEIESGKEKISLKIKGAENGVSYEIKEGDFINVYATLRNDLGIEFLKNKERLTIGSVEDGYTVIKLLEKVSVLDSFDMDGNKIKESEFKIIDTIMIPVTKEEAKEINLLRDIAVFNITGVEKEPVIIQP